MALLDDVVNALRHAVDLRIITTVCDVTLDKFEEGPTITLGSPQKTAVTSVDLLQGDIKNAMHPDFMSKDDPSLRDFHLQQVKLGQDIVANNLRTLVELMERVWDKIRDHEAVTGVQPGIQPGIQPPAKN